MNQSSVPFVDLTIQNARVADVVAEGFAEVLDTTSFVLGPHVERFERDYADFCGVAECVGVGNGTDAIELALRAVGVGADDEVVVPANTFVATAEAVARVGARVVLADVTADHLIDPTSVAQQLTGRTRAVIGVDLYGQIAPFEDLRAVVPEDVVLVEDAAQSQGASRWGVRSGAVADVASTSFYPGKNLGAYGDAGAVVTDDEALATTVRTLGNHGGLKKYAHDIIGMNSRLDGLQAVVLRAKLTRLAVWNAARRAAAARYDALLADVDVVRPTTLEGNEHVWHLYVVRVPGDGTPARRDEVLGKLNAAGIGAGIHYPQPVHLTPAYAGLGYRAGAFPHAEAAANEILSLPLYPQITVDQQEAVVAALKAALA